jgi:hypothetical protein
VVQALADRPEKAAQAVTLRLVPNVSELPVNNLSDIAAMARKFADAVDAGEFPELATAMLVLEDGGSILTFHWGDCPTRYEAIGILETAKQVIVRDAIDD